MRNRKLMACSRAALRSCVLALAGVACGGRQEGGSGRHVSRHRRRWPERQGLQRAGQQGRLDGEKRSASRRACSRHEGSGLRPEPLDCAQSGADLTIAVGFLMGDSLNAVAAKFPNSKFAIIDFSFADLKAKPKNTRGILFRSRRPATSPVGCDQDADGAEEATRHRCRRRSQDPAGRPLHRRATRLARRPRTRRRRCCTATRRTSPIRASARRSR